MASDDKYDLTDREAWDALLRGERVAHRHFNQGAWLTLVEGLLRSDTGERNYTTFSISCGIRKWRIVPRTVTVELTPEQVVYVARNITTKPPGCGDSFSELGKSVYSVFAKKRDELERKP